MMSQAGLCSLELVSYLANSITIKIYGDKLVDYHSSCQTIVGSVWNRLTVCGTQVTVISFCLNGILRDIPGAGDDLQEAKNMQRLTIFLYRYFYCISAPRKILIQWRNV